LLVERGAVQFEARAPQDATLDDLDPQQVQAYLDKVTQAGLLPGSLTADELLFRRGCLKRVDGTYQPTYAGLLLFSRYPQQWLPNATILAGRFPGYNLSDTYLKQDITGTLPEQLRQAEAFVQSNLKSSVRMVGLTHREAPEYPLDAVRELLVNAVAHRDYNQQGDNIHLFIFADRLEVQSPGGLPGPVTLHNLLEARFARNVIITQVLSDLGFVERLGYGLDRVFESMKSMKLPPPHFEEVAGSFRVTLENAHNDLPGDQGSGYQYEVDLSLYQRLNLHPRQQAALEYLSRYQRITSHQYQELCPEVHAETLRRDLVDLVSQGILIKVGDKRATYYILKQLPGNLH
jgi:ATP-dependent DNA helicase RecG